MDEQVNPLEMLTLAETAARAGAEVVMDYFEKGVEFQTKENAEESYNLVTQADIDCEAAIAKVILSAFPDHTILGEETHKGDANAECLWILDPIDGTNNFAHRIPQFGVSVAFYHNGAAAAGVVLNPAREECFSAAAGQGATMNREPIQVSEANAIDQAVISTGFYYDRGPMMQATLDAMADLFRRNVHGLRRFGAASLDLCMVASGQCEAYFEFKLSPWDFAAGQLILHEAGGQATSCLGTPLPIDASPILASNGKIHAELLAILEPFVSRLD